MPDFTRRCAPREAAAVIARFADEGDTVQAWIGPGMFGGIPIRSDRSTVVRAMRSWGDHGPEHQALYDVGVMDDGPGDRIVSIRAVPWSEVDDEERCRLQGHDWVNGLNLGISHPRDVPTMSVRQVCSRCRDPRILHEPREVLRRRRRRDRVG